MKALTVRQPHAALIAAGLKLIESKPQRTNYRGKVAIHAGKAWGKKEKGIHMNFVQRFPNTEGVLYGITTFTGFAFGAVIAIAEIVDCIPAEELALTDQERAFGDYSAGRYGWMLANVERLESPVYCKGQLGLWNWSADGFDERMIYTLATLP